MDRGQPGLHGSASFYGLGFQGRPTASGERFDAHGYTAASNRFPLGTLVRVQRLSSTMCVVVKVNDRMGHRGRLIDLSRAAGERIGILRTGVSMVRVMRAPKGARPGGDCHID